MALLTLNEYDQKTIARPTGRRQKCVQSAALLGVLEGAVDRKNRLSYTLR
jgi:hypothetical protein